MIRVSIFSVISWHCPPTVFAVYPGVFRFYLLCVNPPALPLVISFLLCLFFPLISWSLYLFHGLSGCLIIASEMYSLCSAKIWSKCFLSCPVSLFLYLKSMFFCMSSGLLHVPWVNSTITSHRGEPDRPQCTMPNWRWSEKDHKKTGADEVSRNRWD